MLLPFVKGVIGVLLILTLAGFVAGVARIHMAILSFLSAGLLVSLAVFESEYKKMQNGGISAVKKAAMIATSSMGKPAVTAKTD